MQIISEKEREKGENQIKLEFVQKKTKENLLEIKYENEINGYNGSSIKKVSITQAYSSLQQSYNKEFIENSLRGMYAIK